MRGNIYKRYHTPEHRYSPVIDISDDYGYDYINNFNSESDYQKSSHKPMLKVYDLNQFNGVHGTGGTSDPIVEEIADTINSRAPRYRETKDGLGKKLSQPNCGKNKETEERIVNGKDVPEGTYPWIGVILKDGDPWCGGSILNHHWIITAAHCFKSEGGANVEKVIFAFRVGSVDRNKGTTYKIGKIITHERFNFDNQMNCDIALMKTLKPIQFNKLVRPVCLPESTLQEPREPKLIVAGWGATDFEDTTVPVILRDVSLDLVKDIDCAKKYKRLRYVIYKSQFCTWTKNKDSCQGDSGGPAIEIIADTAYLVGVISYGTTCADDFPGVYTQTSFFLPWITNTLENN